MREGSIVVYTPLLPDEGGMYTTVFDNHGPLYKVVRYYKGQTHHKCVSLITGVSWMLSEREIKPISEE